MTHGVCQSSEVVSNRAFLVNYYQTPSFPHTRGVLNKEFPGHDRRAGNDISGKQVYFVRCSRNYRGRNVDDCFDGIEEDEDIAKDFDDEERKKGGLRIKPDSAYNNQCDMEASEYVYAMCQEWKVPMIVLTRHAAYACPIPRVVYEDMAKTGHPIAVRLYNEQKNSILSLWKRATSPIGDPTREELPDRCDKEWFCKTFMGGKGHDQDVSERSERALRKTRNI